MIIHCSQKLAARLAGVSPTPLEEASPLGSWHGHLFTLDRRLSLLRETEAQVDANLQRAERLRQSILSRAFSGASGYAALTRPTQSAFSGESGYAALTRPTGGGERTLSGYAPLTRPTRDCPAGETDWPMVAEPRDDYVAGES